MVPDETADPNALSAETPEQDEELELALDQEVALVEPILTGLFEAAATNRDYWLKKKNLQILASWLQHVIGYNSALTVKVEALEAALAQAAEASVDSKIWTPH